MVIFINGGGFSVRVKELGIDVDFRAKSLIDKISAFLDAQSRRKVVDAVRRKIKSLKIKDSDQVLRLLHEFKKPKEKELKKPEDPQEPAAPEEPKQP